MNDAPLVTLEGVHKRFDGVDRPVLQDVSMTLHRGDAVAIVGPSGSGKSTLLFVMGLLDRPSSGTVRIDGRDVGSLDERARAALRRDRIGFVLQDHHLLPHATALENVLVPWWADGKPTSVHREQATALLADLGLSDRLTHLPGALSTGQRQRVAVARALVRGPDVLLADEPTGALDSARAQALTETLLGLDGVARVVVTHDEAMAARFTRRFRLVDGVLTAWDG